MTGPTIPAMTDALDGRTRSHGIRGYQRWIGSTIVIAAVILFSVGWWAAAIGTLLGLFFFRVTTRRIGGTFRRPDGDSRRPSGLWTVVGIQVTTMAVFIFITLVVG